MPLIGPLPVELTEKRVYANRKREEAWIKRIRSEASKLESDFEIPAMTSLERARAVHEPPKTFIKALGLAMDRISGGASNRKRQPILLTPKRTNFRSGQRRW
jgi:hypothetical protein